MNDSDISLNVMKDTIGSNVICTSMATGLAMVVSDVGLYGTIAMRLMHVSVLLPMIL